MTSVAVKSAAGVWASALLLCAWPAAAQPDAETLAWNAIADSQSAGEFEEFLRAFPKGKFAKDARQKYSLFGHTKLAPRTHKLDVIYPKGASDLYLAVKSGRIVRLDIVVRADGTPGAIKVTRHSGVDAMDYAAVGAAKRASYLPAVDNGVAVSEHLPLAIRFNIPCSPLDLPTNCKDGEVD